MGKYFKAAFLVRLPVAGLGDVPVNVLALVALASLGLVNPGFWLLGAALEAGLVVSLASNARFRSLVDGRYLDRAAHDVEHKRQALAAGLSAVSRERLRVLSERAARVISLCEEAQSDSFVIEGNRQTLRSLEWIYLKLLVAEANLRGQAADDGQSLTKKIDRLESEIEGAGTAALRQSKMSTLEILRKRLALWRRREQSLSEIASDLTRVEAQVELLLEHAALEGQPAAVDLEIELATDLVSGAVFGEAEAAVHDVEQAYRLAAASRAKQADAPRG